MDKLLASILIFIIAYGHLLLLLEQPRSLAPKFVGYRPDGFAALWVGGKFIRYLDMR